MFKKIKTVKDIETKYNLLRKVLAVAISLILAFLIIFMISDQPLGAIKSLIIGPISSLRRFGNVIEMLTPLLFTGAAVCIIFSSDQINMAVEGAFLVGAVGATLSANLLSFPAGVHHIVSMVLAGILGGLVCFVPAFLYVRYKAQPVVSSLMMNFLCFYISMGIINHILRDPAAGFLASYKFKESTTLPKIIKGTSVHVGIILAILAVIFSYLYLMRSPRGYEVRMLGHNSDFARYSGMPVSSILIKSQIIGGFIAGVGGAVEVLGMYQRFQYQDQTGHGFDGILIAIMAGFNPKFLPLTALFLAYIRTGANIMSRVNDIPVELVSIIQAIIIMLIVAERFLYKQKHRELFEISRASMEQEE